jgi:hypothetical protein
MRIVSSFTAGSKDTIFSGKEIKERQELNFFGLVLSLAL